MALPNPFSEDAFAPMCTPAKGVSWFAISFIRHDRRETQAEFIKAVGGNNGRGWRRLQAQGWRIVRVKVVAQ
jgi:hypothetical protein